MLIVIGKDYLRERNVTVRPAWLPVQEGSVDGAPDCEGVGGGGRISAEIRGGLPRHLKSVPSLFSKPVPYSIEILHAVSYKSSKISMLKFISQNTKSFGWCNCLQFVSCSYVIFCSNKSNSLKKIFSTS